ncbi:LysR substrate-binding domain-containing protein [Atopobiaceae bacterium HCP3S3_F7]
MLDFRVRTFLTACDTLNFTKAARELCITQPAVSQHIRYLEESYGVTLFSHEGKVTRLTSAGIALRDTMRQMATDEARLRERLASGADAPAAVSFGVTMTVGEYAVAAPLAAYLRRHPQARVSVTLGNTASLLARLDAGEIDFALVEGNFDRTGRGTLPYSTEEFVAACASGHRFAREPRVLDDLLDQRLVVRERGSGTRAILEQSLALRNLRVEDFRQRVQVGSIHGIIQLLRYDCGVSFLYRTALEGDLGRGELRLIELEGFPLRHDFAFVWNAGSVFAEEVRRTCAELCELGRAELEADRT